MEGRTKTDFKVESLSKLNTLDSSLVKMCSGIKQYKI